MTESEPASSCRLPGITEDAIIKRHSDKDDAHRHDGNGRAKGPVAANPELLLKQVSKKHRLRAAQQIRHYELAERWQHDKKEASNRSVPDLGPDRISESVPAISAQILCSFHEGVIQFLHRGINWKSREWKIVANQADKHRGP